MRPLSITISRKKVIIHAGYRLCINAADLVSSPAFRQVVGLSIEALQRRKSVLLHMFGKDTVTGEDVDLLVKTLGMLTTMPLDWVVKIVPETTSLAERKEVLFNYVEFLYNFWRSYDRFIILDSNGDKLDKHPYSTFHGTIEQITHLVREVYRDIQKNITGETPNVYRQVRAGASVATIALPKDVPMPDPYSKLLGNVLIVRQVLLNPPLVLDPPMNKRTGQFERVLENPFDRIVMNPAEYVCYPAKVGPLVILVYIHETFYELGFSLANLFEIATDADLAKKPDGIYVFGVTGGVTDGMGKYPTIYYDDEANDLIVAAVPARDEFGYFGYLKKMVLTLHNIAMMKAGRLPFHGAMTRIVMDGDREYNVLVIGDTGAGKSETLEAFRELGSDRVSDIIVIADDMGSLVTDEDGAIVAQGTEIGAFLRMDDLSPSVAFGQIDRAIFMSPGRVNTRIVIPVTSLHHVLAGTPVDYLLYANNYDEVDGDHPILERIGNVDDALAIFREGKVMSKGTTTSTGIVSSYFANIFGPPDYVPLHDELARSFFTRLIDRGVFVGQLRTRLGIPGFERSGPLEAAKALIELFSATAR